MDRMQKSNLENKNGFKSMCGWEGSRFIIKQVPNIICTKH